MRFLLLLAITSFQFTVWAQLPAFNATQQPTAPDYSLPKYWSALPFRTDAADVIPKSEEWISDSLKEVDVFYIYPTIYQKGKTWNADVNNKSLNSKIDSKPVHYQASVFNASARVYAPRYRQGIVTCFYDSLNGPLALDFAYQDVKKAFEYYLKNYNNGRPIIIASHSQGSLHARRLLKEYFDNNMLRNRLVAAYVIGYAMDEFSYELLKPCIDENQTGCYITWSSYKKGFEPGVSKLIGNICINPLTWTRDSSLVTKDKSKGAILLSLNKKYKQKVATQIHSNFLWVDCNIPVIRCWKVLHIADYNLFWFDIRANVKQRISAFWKQ